MRASRCVPLLLCLLVASCTEAFSPPYLIEYTRVLGMRAAPAEVAGGQIVTVDALVMDEDGPLENAALSFWSCPLAREDILDVDPLCAERDVLGGGQVVEVTAENGIFVEEFAAGAAAVGPFSRTQRWLATLLGHNAVVGVSIAREDRSPAEAFKRYSVFPQQSLSAVDETLAPFDVRLLDSGELRRNQNPVLLGVDVLEEGGSQKVVETVRRGQTVRLSPRYDEDTFESYRTLDADLSDLDLNSDDAFDLMPEPERRRRFAAVQRCEVPTFHWFVTGGALRREVTRDADILWRVYAERGVTCTDVPPDDFPAVRFTWPEEARAPEDGLVHAAVVIRDGRGGSSWLTFDLEVED